MKGFIERAGGRGDLAAFRRVGIDIGEVGEAGPQRRLAMQGYAMRGGWLRRAAGCRNRGKHGEEKQRNEVLALVRRGIDTHPPLLPKSIRVPVTIVARASAGASREVLEIGRAAG
jgi:hypothetical protein